MKVLFISQYYLPQPLANAEVIGGLVTSLGDEGHEVTVVSPVAGATPSRNVRHRRALGYFAADRRSTMGSAAEYGIGLDRKPVVGSRQRHPTWWW